MNYYAAICFYSESNQYKMHIKILIIQSVFAMHKRDNRHISETAQNATRKRTYYTNFIPNISF